MDLFGEHNKTRINVALFTDERKNICDAWNYISTIIIPTNLFNPFYETLMTHRKNVGYFNELIFREIGKSGPKLELAKLWLSEILNDENNKIYFKILGLDRRHFDENIFGDGSLKKGSNYANLYNRFFRTNILSIKYFFNKYDEIIIDKIFHDTEGNLENHHLFDWHCIWKLETDSKIKSKFSKVVFVDSNHFEEKTHPKVSQIIQFSDLLVGTVSHCLDFEIKDHRGRNELGSIIFPLLKRILKSPLNVNSSYKYYRKYDVSFFPKSVPKEYQELKQYLHKDRVISIAPLMNKIENKISGQEELW